MTAIESSQDNQATPDTKSKFAPDTSEREPEQPRQALRLFLTWFLGVSLIAALVLTVALGAFYRAEMADLAPVLASSAAPPACQDTAMAPDGQAATRAGRQMLPRLWLLGAVLFALMATGAWLLADARAKWRQTRRRAEELANFDAVTGLPNRSLFFDRLERFHLHSARYRRRYGLILLDLDGFGQVNEQFGYGDGDQLLIRVGRMLTNSLRNSDTIARVGGDEFAVLLSEVSDIDAAMMLGRKVVAAVGAPIRLPNGEAEISASVGVAVFPDHGGSVAEMLQAADHAMDRAKREGQGRCLLAGEASSAGARLI
jgi:diguanylate cyclase (GGDEF)-like protein